MFDISPFPAFSWSLSRHKTLTSCARKYGYEYYFAHNGWLSYQVEPFHQHVYRLKKLQAMPILFGQIVHRLIEQTIIDYLQTGAVPSVAELVNRARGQLNAELITDYKSRLEAVFTNFLLSETFMQITAQTGSLRIGEPEQFRSMKIEDTQVFVVMDFHYYDEMADKWIIIDWKTGGKSDDDRQQLALYAYYVQQKYGVTLEKIEVYNEYLLTGQRKQYTFTSFDMDTILHTFRRSVLEMKKFQADILTNEPVDIEDFQQTTDEWRCKGCNFKELCYTR